MRGVWVQVTARQHSSLCRGCPSPRVWPEQERWWEPVPSPAGAPRAAGGEDGRLLSKEGGGQPWHLWKGSLMTLILLAQLRVSQGFAPDGVGVGGQGSQTWCYSLHWQSQLGGSGLGGSICAGPGGSGRPPTHPVPYLRGGAVLGASSVHSARKSRGLGPSLGLDCGLQSKRRILVSPGSMLGQLQVESSRSLLWSEYPAPPPPACPR